MRIERFRWWHIAEAVPIEEDLFGAERWTAAMFWNELANGHYYLVALRDEPPAAVLNHADTPSAAGAKRAEVPAADAPQAAQVVGYGGLAVVDSEAWVQNLAVRRDEQRRGIGRALLVALLDEAARRDARRVLLEVAVDNAPAQRLYALHGFEPIGVRRGYYQPSNIDALVMQRVQ